MPYLNAGKRKDVKLLFSFLLFILATLCFFRFSRDMSLGIQKGLVLTYSIVIPKLFPIFILSDYFMSIADIHTYFRFPELFSRVFHLSKAAFFPVFLGLFFGFPLGITNAVFAYRNGSLSKDECERVIIISSIPSPAFLIGGIGGLFHNLRFGFCLYCVSAVCSVLVGCLLGIGKANTENETTTNSRPFSFVESVKSAVFRILSLCGFILFFSGISECAEKLPTPFSFLIISCLEITSASYFLSDLGVTRFSFAALSFCCCFSGFSLLCQAFSLFSSEGLSKSRFFFWKTAEGFLGAVFGLLIYRIFF